MKFYSRKRFIKCLICEKNEQATSNRQIYCENCRKMVEKGQIDKYNANKRQNIIKECTQCHKKVNEVGMKKRCRACIDKDAEVKLNGKICKRCNKVEISSSKVYCSECKRITQLENMRNRYAIHKEKRFCRGCDISIDHISPAKRYCSDKCRNKNGSVPVSKKKTIKNTIKKKVTDELPLEEQTSQMQLRTKDEETAINPFFLQKRGSGRK